jgi:CRISPR system Cascade subunit CasD
MIQALLLRLDAPLLSFGGVSVDQRGPVDVFPSCSMLTGLLGNALGYDHADGARLSRLQERLRIAARRDRPGERILDFQTVDLGQGFLVDTGWTTRGKREDRGGGTAKEGTHIRYREYWADALFTVALSVEPGEPDLDALAEALRYPERPLFIGRKPCLPSGPIFLDKVSAPSLLDALRQAPRVRGRSHEGPLLACWPVDEAVTTNSRRVSVHDQRDWWNQIHTGARQIREGWIEPTEVSHG